MLQLLKHQLALLSRSTSHGSEHFSLAYPTQKRNTTSRDHLQKITRSIWNQIFKKSLGRVGQRGYHLPAPVTSRATSRYYSPVFCLKSTTQTVRHFRDFHQMLTAVILMPTFFPRSHDLRSDHKQQRFLERYEMQTYLIIYRKEKRTGGYFTSKNRVFSSKSKRNGKKGKFQGRGRVPGESGLHQGFQIILECVVGSNLFFSHLDCFKENVGQIRLFYD